MTVFHLATLSDLKDTTYMNLFRNSSLIKGKSDVSTVVYRVGECMQELLNLWKEYKSANASDKMSEISKNFPTLEIRIAAEHVTAINRQVKGGQLWGTDIYTHDSDIVAGYVSTLRNSVRSRAWGAAIGCGCSFRVERCHIVKKAGGTIDLEPCLTHTSTVEPTLAPVVVERTMTTRAAASNALRQQRFVREVTLQYNLCNEPWIKFSISAIADKGLKKPSFTSARLKKGEVLYLESPTRSQASYGFVYDDSKQSNPEEGYEEKPATSNEFMSEEALVGWVKSRALNNGYILVRRTKKSKTTDSVIVVVSTIASQSLDGQVARKSVVRFN
ncbi:hypothetical protein R6Q59_028248 [Mikania micrantha]